LEPGGYIAKDARREQIVDAGARMRPRRDGFAARACVGLASERFACGRPTTHRSLTDREAEILRLIAAGKSLPAIAKELFLGVTTSRPTRSTSTRSWKYPTRAAAVAEAMRRGLIE